MRNEINKKTRTAVTVLITAAIMGVLSLPAQLVNNQLIYKTTEHSVEECGVVDKQARYYGRGGMHYTLQLELEDGSQTELSYCSENTFNDTNEGDVITCDVYRKEDKIIRIELAN